MEEVLRVRIYQDGIEPVKGGSCQIQMISFHGEASGKYFHGRTISHGIDTQTYDANLGLMSARYMLEGEDFKGQKCRMFIENNGVGERLIPKLVTDSKALSWLETASLVGQLYMEGDVVEVRFFTEQTEYQIVRLYDKPELKERMAAWFHEKWCIPEEAYLESMEECLSGESTVPQWYTVMQGDKIVGGLGVIANDFHDRKDLTPNVCAVYVEADYRCQGIAGKMLNFVCDDMSAKGIDTLYLVTDHTSFYERYGWEFLCMVQGDDEPDMTRMYIHK